MDTFTLFVLYTASIVLLVVIAYVCAIMYTQDFTPRRVQFSLIVASIAMVGCTSILVAETNGGVNIILHSLSGMCVGMVLVKIMITHNKR